MCSRTPSPGGCGYSLVEVLVAMVILALVLTVLMRIFSSGLVSIDRASDVARAVMVAESHLASAGAGEDVMPGRSWGTDDGFTWTRTVEPYSPEDAQSYGAVPVDAFVITVAVDWMTGSSTRNLELSTIRLVPSVGAGR